FLPAGRQPGPNASRSALVPQMEQGRLFADAAPQAAQLRTVAEMANTGEADGEARRADPRQARIDVVELCAIHLTDKAERQVEAFRLDPAHAGQPAGEQAQLPAYRFG